MKKSSLAASLSMLGVGLLIIVAAAILMRPIIPLETDKYIFMWNSIGLVYILGFLPVFVNQLTVRNADRKVISGIIFYRGYIVYALLSAGIIVLLFLFLEMKYAILLQVAALFIFVLYILISHLVSGHVNKVETAETQKTALIDELRAKAANLVIMADRLGDQDRDIKEMARKYSENVRYLTASSDPNALNLDRGLVQLTDSLLADFYFVNPANASRDALLKKFDTLNTLYLQRKAIY